MILQEYNQESSDFGKATGQTILIFKEFQGKRGGVEKETSEAYQPIALYGPHFGQISNKCTIKNFKTSRAM